MKRIDLTAWLSWLRSVYDAGPNTARASVALVALVKAVNDKAGEILEPLRARADAWSKLSLDPWWAEHVDMTAALTHAIDAVAGGTDIHDYVLGGPASGWDAMHAMGARAAQLYNAAVDAARAYADAAPGGADYGSTLLEAVRSTFIGVARATEHAGPGEDPTVLDRYEQTVQELSDGASDIVDDFKDTIITGIVVGGTVLLVAGAIYLWKA